MVQEDNNNSNNNGSHPLLVELGLAPAGERSNADCKNHEQDSENPITSLDVLQRLLESSASGGAEIKEAYESLVRAAYESLREERKNCQKSSTAVATVDPSTTAKDTPQTTEDVTGGMASAGSTSTGPSTEKTAVTSASNNSKATSDNTNKVDDEQAGKTIPPADAGSLDEMDFTTVDQPRPGGETVEPSINNHADQEAPQDKASNNSDKVSLNNDNKNGNLSLETKQDDTQETEMDDVQKTELKDVQESELEGLQKAEKKNAQEDAQKIEKKAPDESTTMESQFDYRTRHIALHLCYEGKRYSGLAQNVGMESDNSVERQLFQALRTSRLILSRETSSYSRCGRTDKGVSAAGQVVALQLKSAIPRNASWDPEGIHPVGDDDASRLPKNSFEKIRVWVTPKPKKNKNKKHKKNDDKQKDDKGKLRKSGADAAHTLAPTANATLGPTPDSASGPTNDTTAKSMPGHNPDLTSDTKPSDSMEEAKQPQTSKRVLKEIFEYPYDKMLNGLLPQDIRILGWCPVSNDFSARFSSNKRTYRYFFVQRGDLNLEAMREGLKLLEGNHDFRNFCKMNVIEVSNFQRKIHSAELIALSTPDTQYNGQVCFFQIQGQAFLWHQIRCIVSVLFMIGRGLESPSVITELLNIQKHPAKPSYPLASEYPLVLHACGYPNLSIGYSVQNCWTVTCQLEEQWESLVLEAARVRNCLERLKQVDNIRRSELVEFANGRLLERNKKQQRNKQISASSQGQEDWLSFSEQLKKEQTEAEQQNQPMFISWGEAIEWLKRWKIIVDYNGLRDHIHVPLLQRSKGTTYEEKIESLQQSCTKRSQRFEENTAKKQNSTKEGDAQFYEHMLKQGGSGTSPAQGSTTGSTQSTTIEPIRVPTTGLTPEKGNSTNADPTPRPASGSIEGTAPESASSPVVDSTSDP